MPIKITDYEWKQNESLAFIKFGLKRTNPKNVDIVYTTNYLKVNFNPYIFEVFLKHKIDPEKSSAIIKEGNFHFQLSKAISEPWESLDINPKSKVDAQQLRLASLREYEDYQNKKAKEKKENKSALERLAISKQISLNDEKHLERKELLKQEEIKFFKDCSANFESSKKEDRMRLSSLCSEDGSTVASEGGYDGDEESVNHSSTENLSSMRKCKSSKDELNFNEAEREESYPRIRQNICIKMHHSLHKISIPKRESLSSSQEEDTVNPQETKNAVDEKVFQDKESLKSEASKCFECGDYDGTVKIYSILLESFPSQASFYSNRAAAFIALNAYKEAVKDCTKALELLSPESKENSKSRLLCHVRRGTAYVRLRDLSLALVDFDAAFRLDPSNVDLAKDAAAIRECLKTCTDTGEDSSEDQNSCEEQQSEINDVHNKSKKDDSTSELSSS